MLKIFFKRNNINNLNPDRITIKNSKNPYNFLILIVLILISGFSIFFSQPSYNKYLKIELKPFNSFLMKSGFTLKKVEILGINNLTKEAILKIVHSHNKSNIFDLNLLEIHNKLNLNGWVKSIYIERILPDKIKIKIKEKQPVAIMQNENGNTLITKHGEIISTININKFKNNLPIISGDDSNKNAYSILEIMKRNKDFSKNIWSLNYINKRRWNLHFNQGLIILLPSKGIIDAWEKIVKLQKNYNILNLGLTEIDVRNRNQILGKINFDKNLILHRKNL